MRSQQNRKSLSLKNSPSKAPSKPHESVKQHCSRNCKQHNFELQVNVPNDKYIQSISLKLCKNRETTAEMPILMKQMIKEDSLPLFVNSHRQAQIKHEVQKYRKKLLQIQQRERLNAQKYENEIFIAMPTRRYCKTCQNDYRDYLNHISSPEHINALSKNRQQHTNITFANQFRKKAKFQEKVQQFQAQVSTIEDGLSGVADKLKGIFKQFQV